MESLGLIEQFAGKFEKFIYLYKELRKDNEKLKDVVDKLNFELSKKDILIKELEHKLEISTLAETFTVSSEGSSQEAKIKINNIVREIDNCIALLNR